MATGTRTVSERGHRLVLASHAPQELVSIVRSLLVSDELLESFPPLGTPGQTTRVARVEVGAAHWMRRYAVKRYVWPPLDAVRTLGRATRARSEFETLEAIESLVPVPVRAAAWGEARTFGFARRSVVVTELLEGAVDLKAWRLAWLRGERPAIEREQLVRALPALARLMRRLHDAGFFAAHAFQKNVLWRPGAPADEAFALVDLPFGTLSSAPVAERHRIYDLACLDKDASMVLTRSERLRFYLAYIGCERVDERDRSVLARVRQVRARRAHATFFSGIERSLKKAIKRTLVGKLLTGRSPERDLRGER